MYHYHDDRFSFENLDLVGMAQADNFLLFSSQVVGHIFCFKKKLVGGWANHLKNMLVKLETFPK